MTTPEKRFFIKRVHTTRIVPSGAEVNYMNYSVFDSEVGLRALRSFLSLPCKARLHHLLTGLFYNWDWENEETKEITEEEAMMLKHIFASQKEYKLWQKAMEKLKAEGSEKAREWLVDQTKVLALRNLLQGKDP